MKWRLDDGQIEVLDDEVAEVLRRKTPAERMALVGEAWDFARRWVRAAVRAEQPDWDESAVQAEVSRRLLNATACTFKQGH